MIKKLTLLALSAAALVAFAVPAVAQAESAVVTDANGQPLNTLVATSSNTLSTTTSATLSCQEVRLHINLSDNTAPGATGNGDGEAENCLAAGMFPVVITEVDVNHIEIDGGGTGSAEFTYSYHLFGNECHFEGNADITYVPTSHNISIAGDLTSTSGGACPPEGEIHGDFTVTDVNGNPASIH